MKMIHAGAASEYALPVAPFDSLTLRAVVAELSERLVGGRIQDARQPAPTEARLGIRSRGQNFWLALSSDARFARVHLTGARDSNAPKPPAFCMALRKYLEGGVILAVRQRGFDRIFELEVETRDAEGERIVVTLIAELMGKHSNLILVTADGAILDSARRVSRRINRLRETLPGLPYQPPPTQTDRRDPFAPDAVAAVLTACPALEPEALFAFLTQTFAGMSPFLSREIVQRIPREGEGEEGLRAAWESLFGRTAEGDFSPVRLRDAAGNPVGAYPFPTAQWPTNAQEALNDLDAGLDEGFTFALKRAGFESTAGELRGKIAQERKRLERQRQAVERTLQEAHRAEEYQQAGELLIANLWRVPPGESSLTVQDFYAESLPERVLTLDPKLSPQENAESYFRRARKIRDGQEQARQREAQAAAALLRMEAAAAKLASLETAEEVRGLRAELLAAGALRETDEGKQSGHEGPDFQGHKIRRFTTPEGYEIYIGETATANDFLTTRLAAPTDIWLHVRAATGSHVVIRAKGHPEAVPRGVLEQAALLCARHSAQKHSSLVAVDYTLKKHVRKPRGAAPGLVQIQQEKTLHVTP